MNKVSEVTLETLNSTPEGHKIAKFFLHLKRGHYALMPNRLEQTTVLKKTRSQGTDFYRVVSTATVPFESIKKTGLLPQHFVELNASPAGSESQEYGDALVFSV